MNKHKKAAEKKRLDCNTDGATTVHTLNDQYKALHPVLKVLVLALFLPLAPLGYTLMLIEKHKGGRDE